MRQLHVIAGWTLVAAGLFVGAWTAGAFAPFDGIGMAAFALCAGSVGAWIGWCVAGSPTLAIPLEHDRARWDALGDAGLGRGEGCALGAVRRQMWAPPETLSHPCGHRLVLGAGHAAEEAFNIAASTWPGALVMVDTHGLSRRLSRDDVVRFAPGRQDTLRINPLLMIRRGPHAWRDASILAAGLAPTDGNIAVALATVLLDHLHTAEPSERTLDGVRRRLLDPDQVVASIINAVHEQGPGGVWRAHPEIVRIARVWRSDRATARARLIEAERALRLLQDGRLVEATGALDVRLADPASDGPKTIVIEAPPGDGDRYGPFFAALLGQLVAALTDAGDTDGWGRTKTRRVLLAIDDPRLLGVVPLLAQRARDADRCGLELLVRADTVEDALGLFGAGQPLSVFEAVVAAGPQSASSAAALVARAGSHAVLQLRGSAGRDWWSRFVPVIERFMASSLSPAVLKRADRDTAHILLSGLKPAWAAAEQGFVRGGLRLRTEALAPPAHDWSGAAAAAPEGCEKAVSVKAAPRALPLFEAASEDPDEESDEGDDDGDENVKARSGSDNFSRRLRAGLARGGKSRVK